MTAFTLDPKPTFKLTVEIPVPGESFAPVEFTCKYRNRADLVALTGQVIGDAEKGVSGLSDADTVKAIVEGWSLSDPCTPENLAKLAGNYPGAASAIYLAYLDELLKVRRKN